MPTIKNCTAPFGQRKPSQNIVIDSDAGRHDRCLLGFIAGGDVDRVLNKKEVTEKTSMSRATIDRAVRSGLFPPPIKLSARRVGWLESVVDGWLEERQRLVIHCPN